jgi:hypothetical protein
MYLTQSPWCLEQSHTARGIILPSSSNPSLFTRGQSVHTIFAHAGLPPGLLTIQMS